MTKASPKRFVYALMVGFLFLLLPLQGCASPTQQSPAPITTSGSISVPNPVPTDEGVVRRVQPVTQAPTNTLSSNIARSTENPTAPETHGLLTYTVQSGDTLFGIAGVFSLAPQTVLWSNYATLKDNPDSVLPGIVLVIPPSDGLITIAQEGDTITILARRFQVTPESILKEPLNGLNRMDQMLSAGQQLFIPGGQGAAIVWAVPNTVVTQTPIATSMIACGLGLLNAHVNIWVAGQQAEKVCARLITMIRQQGGQPTTWDGTIPRSARGYHPVCSDTLPTLMYEVVAVSGFPDFSIYGTEWCRWMAQTFGASGALTAPDFFGIISGPRPTQVPCVGATYIVQEGDTFHEIAQKCNKPVEELKHINNLNTDLLTVGQMLIISTVALPSTPVTPTIQPTKSR